MSATLVVFFGVIVTVIELCLAAALLSIPFFVIRKGYRRWCARHASHMTALRRRADRQAEHRALFGR